MLQHARFPSQLLLPLMLLVAAPPAGAQELALKRALPPIAWEGCVPQEPPRDVTPADRDEAARLAVAATQASILGDDEEALRHLTRAVVLDPGAADLVYRLAVALEQLERPRDAAATYCRYLALAPAAADAEGVRGRIPTLVGRAPSGIRATAADAFTAGIAFHDSGDLAGAESAFLQARQIEPAWSDALYNLGVVRIAAGRTAAGRDDLQQYLRSNPEAADAGRVQGALLALLEAPAPPHRPDLALMSGLFVPGLGHFTTGRPLTGMFVLGAAAGAIGAAIGVERLHIACLAPPTGGRCPSDQIAQQRTSRPYLGPGMAAAAAVSALGAIDAYRGARSRNDRALELWRTGARRDEGGPALLPPVVRPGAGEVQLEFLRIRF